MASKRRMCSADWFRSAFDCCYYRRPMEERAINFPLSSSCRMSRQHPPLLRPRCIGLCPPTGDALNVLGVGCLYLIFFFFSSWRRFLLLLLLRRCHFPPNLLYPPSFFPSESAFLYLSFRWSNLPSFTAIVAEFAHIRAGCSIPIQRSSQSGAGWRIKHTHTYTEEWKRENDSVGFNWTPINSRSVARTIWISTQQVDAMIAITTGIGVSLGRQNQQPKCWWLKPAANCAEIIFLRRFHCVANQSRMAIAIKVECSINGNSFPFLLFYKLSVETKQRPIKPHTHTHTHSVATFSNCSHIGRTAPRGASHRRMAAWPHRPET